MHLQYFRKYDFQNIITSTGVILFQPNFLYMFPATIHTKVYFLKFHL